MIRTPDETLFWFCPPFPPARNVCTSQSLIVVVKSFSFGCINGLVPLQTARHTSATHSSRVPQNPSRLAERPS